MRSRVSNFPLPSHNLRLFDLQVRVANLSSYISLSTPKLSFLDHYQYHLSMVARRQDACTKFVPGVHMIASECGAVRSTSSSMCLLARLRSSARF